MAKRVIISGGGTGGHIFPAVAIANALKRLDPDTEILFVGANGRMEMEKVPAAGYKIIGLNIQGFQRKSLWKNILLPFKLLKSVLKARVIIREFKPDVAVGVGGYASGPLLYAAGQMNIPYLIQEQNSYAGITNKWLGKKARLICVAFEGMDKFFSRNKLLLTGNPIRKESVAIQDKKEEAYQFFGLSPEKKTILVTGGSLGAGTLNKSMLAGLENMISAGVQLIWQTGKYYYSGIKERVGEKFNGQIKILEFLNRMDLAYAAADVIISRAGAGTIAELCVIKKPVILVPSPNVAEDHQTKNASALVENDAALVVADNLAEKNLVTIALNLIADEKKCNQLSENIAKMALPNADEVIAKKVLEMATKSYPQKEKANISNLLKGDLGVENVYLIGIGGIGMSGLARYFHQRGRLVCGYDRTPTALTSSLIEEGIQVIFEDKIELIPSDFSTPSDSALIIYTPAIPKDSLILNYFRDKGFALKKRSEVLGIISKGMFTIAVGGTHGKTTTSSIVAHILKHSGYDCSAFLGGIATNYNTNVLFGKNNVVVVEADEYDRSFLTLHPDIALITSMDADHLDIYGDKAHLTESFKLFASQIKPGGKLIYRAGLPLENGKTYAADGIADIKAENVRIEKGSFVFDFKSDNGIIPNTELGIPGLHNVENAVAAIEIALLLGISTDKIKDALRAFRGVKRRFEYIVKTDKHIYIDDYAHHPEELRACITAVKSLYPNKKLTTIFQPHLFTRTRDFADGFAEVLDMTDELLMLDIYPARELPIPGVTSAMILEKMESKHTQLGKQEALEFVKNQQPELLLTVGAGDIDTLVEPLKNVLQNA